MTDDSTIGIELLLLRLFLPLPTKATRLLVDQSLLHLLQFEMLLQVLHQSGDLTKVDSDLEIVKRLTLPVLVDLLLLLSREMLHRTGDASYPGDNCSDLVWTSTFSIFPSLFSFAFLALFILVSLVSLHCLQL